MPLLIALSGCSGASSATTVCERRGILTGSPEPSCLFAIASGRHTFVISWTATATGDVLFGATDQEEGGRTRFHLLCDVLAGRNIDCSETADVPFTHQVDQGPLVGEISGTMELPSQLFAFFRILPVRCPQTCNAPTVDTPGNFSLSLT
jgi:hypothetical protein